MRPSIQDTLTEATARLEQSAVASARLDSELLLARVLGAPRLSIFVNAEQALTAQQESMFQSLVERRAAGEPVAYLTGEKEFYSLAFQVNPAVLIPRPETELVVEAAVEKLRLVSRQNDSALFYDIGTGSGAIATATLAHVPQARAIATDVSAAALEIARANAARNGVADRLEFARGDLFAGQSERADAVVSNPPYVADGEAELLARDVRDYEPHGALFAGPDGLSVIRRLISESPNRLNPGGWLIFEIGYTHAAAIRELIERDGRWTSLEIRNDLSAIPRVVIAGFQERVGKRM